VNTEIEMSDAVGVTHFYYLSPVFSNPSMTPKS